MEPSMSFFHALTKERIKCRIYPNLATATSDVFDYVAMFYNSIRWQGSGGDPPYLRRMRALLR